MISSDDHCVVKGEQSRKLEGKKEREKEMEEVKAAEREAGGRSYEGSRVRQNHVGQGVFLKWSTEAENAIKDLASAEDSRLVILVSYA